MAKKVIKVCKLCQGCIKDCKQWNDVEYCPKYEKGESDDNV